MEKLNLQQQVGQRLLAGLAGPVLDEEFTAMVREYKVGNVILMQRNVQSAAQLARLCGDIQALVQRETGHPALIAMDQEGGSVVRLPADALNAPGAMAVASTGNPANARTVGRITGQQLRSRGVNFNLAPALDVNANPKNPVIGERSYGDTPETVASFGIEMMKGLAEGGVLACVKHFPGHGDTHVDSHLALPVINKSLAQLEAVELAPFRAAISAGAPAVMTSHILMPQLEEKGLPNTLSRAVVTGLLREGLGFSGLVVSDCLEMQAIQASYGTVEGAVLAAAAGVDLLCICHTYALVRGAAAALLAAAEDGRLDKDEMLESANRVLCCKRQLAAMPTPALTPQAEAGQQGALRRIRLAGISAVGAPRLPLPAFGTAPFFAGCQAYRSTIASSPVDEALAFPTFMQAAFGGGAMCTQLNPDDEKIAQAVAAAKGASCIVLGCYNACFQPGQAKLMRALAALDAPLVVVALRSPYDLALAPAGAWKLAAFEYTEECFEVLRDIFAGNAVPGGSLSVRLEGVVQ